MMSPFWRSQVAHCNKFQTETIMIRCYSCLFILNTYGDNRLVFFFTIVRPKAKIFFLITLQIIIIVTSFFVLILLENERSLLGETINLSGKNRYFSAILMHDILEFQETKDPSNIMFHFDEFEKNLDKLTSILQKDSEIIIPISNEIKTEFLHIQKDFSILNSEILLDIEDGVTNSRITLYHFMLVDFKTDTDDLTKNLSNHVKELSSQIISLELFLGVINITTHIILIIVIIRIQKNESEKQNELKKELQKKDRLSVIGELSSRLSHDIRNPLSIISITLENLKLTYPVDDVQKKQFDKVQRAVFRITHQIDDVLDFVRKQPLTLNKTKISDVISDALDSVFLPDTLTLKLPKNDVELVCDAKKLSVVLINLVFNGIQAINGRGIIEIRLEENADNVVLEVKDSGKGISKENLDKIFDPLFTTKQTGTGLGLASVKSIIDAHGGTISVTSSPTIFRIELPKNQQNSF